MGDKLIDYSILDGKDRYLIQIKAKDKDRYDMNHVLVYRTLNELKKEGLKPLPKPTKKATKRQNQPPAPAPPGSAQPVVEPTAAEDFIYSEATVVDESAGAADLTFAPQCNSTMVQLNELRSPCHKQVKVAETNLNRSFSELNVEEEELAQDLTPQEEAAAVPPASLISSWMNEAAAHAFLNVMGTFIDQLNMKRTPKKVYEEMSSIMLLIGFKFTATELYEKKRSLDSTYYRARKNNGFLGRTKWPYFDGIDHIHKGVWPEGFQSAPIPKINVPVAATCSSQGASLFGQGECKDNNKWNVDEHLVNEVHEIHAENDEVAIVTQEAQSDFVWDEKADRALVEEMHEANQAFNKGPLVKNIELFAEVARQLCKRGIIVDKKCCSKRYSALQLKFRSEYDDLQRTGAAACRWRLYDIMYELEKDSAAVAPPVTVSVGATSKVKRAYEVMGELQRGRDRAPNPTRQQRAEKLCGKTSQGGSIGYTNRAIELQEKRLELEYSYLEEFRSFRQDSNERSVVFREGIDLLKELNAKRRSDD